MLRATLAGLCLLALPACTTTTTGTTYPRPHPGRLERDSARLREPLVAVVHFSDHASHTLGVVVGSEVSSVSFEPITDSSKFRTSSVAARQWHVVARDLGGREEVVALVAAHEVRSESLPWLPPQPELWISTEKGSGNASALAITLDGHLEGGPETRALSTRSQFAALLALRDARARAEEARQRED